MFAPKIKKTSSRNTENTEGMYATPINPSSSSSVAIKNRSTHARMDKILTLHHSNVGNRLLWNDDWASHITSRNYAEMLSTLDATVEALGGVEMYEAVTTVNPYALTDPVCGSSAQNLFKLMVEDGAPVNPVDMIKKHPSDIEALEKMAPDKNYALLINDARLGHMFLIDISARDKKGYIYQSNLGGSLPELSIADWMKNRSKDGVPIEDIKRYLHKDSLKNNPNQWKSDIARMLEINKDSEKVDMSKVKEDGLVVFHIQQYNESVFDRNLTSLLMQVES